ncbi:hypothetical protein H5410_008993 [Solanum commersonii]|uniref:Uncharacterized protein n=1 Tax=Solanum commersonii TaxID=4109 RepID=A0A9J6AID4_SOLCO|nr:hypothetical protein H5410_008993 [Solanum commersonii]
MGLKTGISPKSGYDYESSYPSNLNTGYVLLLSSGMGTLVEMLEGSRQRITSLWSGRNSISSVVMSVVSQGVRKVAFQDGIPLSS